MAGMTSLLPAIFLHAGSTYRLAVTAADTGLPGRPSTSLGESFQVRVAKVVGLPGFMCTLHRKKKTIGQVTTQILSQRKKKPLLS